MRSPGWVLVFVFLSAEVAEARGSASRPAQCTAYDDAQQVSRFLSNRGSESPPLPNADVEQLIACATRFCDEDRELVPALFRKFPDAPVRDDAMACLSRDCKPTNDSACQNEARQRLRRGSSEDLKRAEALYSDLCPKLPGECLSLVTARQKLGRLSKAEYSQMMPCFNLGGGSQTPTPNEMACAAFAESTLALTNVERVEKLLHWGCQGRQTVLCVPWSRWLTAQHREPEALEVLSMACAGGRNEACNALQETLAKATDHDNTSLVRFLVQTRGNTPFARDAIAQWKEQKTHAADYQQTCLTKGGSACTIAGLMREELDKDMPERARAWFHRACDHGDPAGCYFNAEIQGLSDTQVHALMKQACDGGFPPACTKLGQLWSEEQHRRVELCTRSCKGGDPVGCGDARVLPPRETPVVTAEAGRR